MKQIVRKVLFYLASLDSNRFDHMFFPFILAFASCLRENIPLYILHFGWPKAFFFYWCTFTLFHMSAIHFPLMLSTLIMEYDEYASISKWFERAIHEPKHTCKKKSRKCFKTLVTVALNYVLFTHITCKCRAAVLLLHIFLLWMTTAQRGTKFPVFFAQYEYWIKRIRCFSSEYLIRFACVRFV